MHASYEDIRALTDRKPLWYDENGCPRYAPFHPSLIADIYAEQACLLEIGCQGCEQRFLVAMSYTRWFAPRTMSLAEAVDQRIIHYGDPPRHMDEWGDGCVGETMNCGDYRVVEFWGHTEVWSGWVRMPQYDVTLYEPEEQ